MSAKKKPRRRLSPRARNLFLAGFLLAVVLQMGGSLLFAGLGVALMFVLVLVFDRHALNHMGNWRFWVVAFVVTGLSGWLLGKPDAELWGHSVSLEGLRLGLAIMLRAIVFLFGLSVLSRQIETASMVRFFGRLGMPQLGGAVALAVELLPTMQEQWGKAVRREGKVSVVRKLVLVLADAHDLVERIAAGTEAPSHVVLVTAERNGGKTALLLDVAALATKRGLAVGGFVQPKVLVPFADAPADEGKDTDILGYDLLCLGEEQSRVELCRKKDDGRGWVLSSEAFELAARRLAELREESLVLVDELGLAEAQGEGHWPAVRQALSQSRAELWILAVRKDRAERFLEMLAEHRPVLLDLDAEDADMETSPRNDLERWVTNLEPVEAQV